MNDKPPPQEKGFTEAQPVYVPATVNMPAGPLRDLIRFPIALQETPDQICGTAQRVGHVQVAGQRQALYRLKRKRMFASRKTATLPGFFLLVNGTFVLYSPADTEDTPTGK
jgi:hypothetical protein